MSLDDLSGDVCHECLLGDLWNKALDLLLSGGCVYMNERIQRITIDCIFFIHLNDERDCYRLFQEAQCSKYFGELTL